MPKTHGIPWNEWVEQQVGPTKGFSEFNYLGAYAYEFHRDKFRWIDVDKKQYAPDRVHQFWSWGGLGEEQKRKIDEILK